MKIIALIVLLIVLWLAAMTAYLRRDEPLTPQAEQVLNYQPAPVPAEQNAFVGLAGFPAPAGKDFVRVGEEVIRQVGLEQEPEAELQSFTFSVQDYTYSCTKEITENCLNEIRADADNIQTLLRDNHELIQRYLKIQDMPVFSLSISSIPVKMDWYPSYVEPVKISRLLSAQAMLDIENGDIASGLDWIQKDMTFYRRIFAAEDANFVDKIVAIAQIRRYAILLELLIEEGRLRTQSDKVRTLLLPLDSPREHYKEAAWRERVLVMQGLSRMPAAEFAIKDFLEGMTSNAMFYFLYKHNMTMNLMSEFYGNEMKTIDATPVVRLPDVDVMQETLKRSGCGTGESYFKPCKHLRNFAGETLAKIALADTKDYLLRIYDADAFLRLARAQLEYQLVAKKPDVVPTEILASLPPETFNPYTEKPFDFDAERGVIGFQQINKRDKDKRVEIHLSLH